MTFDPLAAARFIDAAHTARDTFRNMPAEVAPPTVRDAYAAQDALRMLWEPRFGPVVGRKIATTTKVMQALMGIDHPCGGLIYQKRVHTSPATIRKADFMNVVVECELAVRLARDLPATGAPYTGASVLGAVGEVMAAYELIEDRNAVYKGSDARTLIADNSWNGGVVLGKGVPVPAGSDLNGIAAQVTVDGKVRSSGKSDDPMGALAWVANLAVEHGKPMTKGMIVITGSIVATFPVEVGNRVTFEIERIGSVEMTIA
jgi:2-keto-4-pentenoate hydratase